MTFNEMFRDFVDRQGVSILGLVKKMNWQVVGESTMRQWGYGRPAERRTAKKFIEWVVENYPEEDREKWLGSLEAEKAA